MPKRLSVIAVALAAAAAAGTVAPVATKAGQVPAAPAQQLHEQTVTLAVRNMTCALCPVTVKKAITAVSGVRSVQVDFAAKTATVMFDPSATSVAEIAAASGDAGYPAEPAGSQ